MTAACTVRVETSLSWLFPFVKTAPPARWRVVPMMIAKIMVVIATMITVLMVQATAWTTSSNT